MGGKMTPAPSTTNPFFFFFFFFPPLEENVYRSLIYFGVSNSVVEQYTIFIYISFVHSWFL